MKKRLIALMVAGVMSTATLTGCGNEGTVDKHYLGGGVVHDGYIVIKQNDSHILHKGDYYRANDGETNGFRFDCGEDFWSNAEHFASNEEPKPERYDEKCEECFDLNQ